VQQSLRVRRHPRKAEDTRGHERFLDQLLPTLWQKIVEQGQLQALRIAASHSDTKAMGRANASAGTDAKESGRLSKALGMHVCFQ
jgi:hypothetical protein